MRKLTPEQRELYARLEVPKLDWGKPSGAAIAFAHALMVPAGPHVNTPLRLRKFQIDFIRAVYNPMEGGKRVVRQAILSVARRNGKTLTASVLLLAHLAGPFKKPNATIVSAATTRAQAGLVFRFVKDMVRVNPWLQKRVKVIDSVKRIVHRDDGSYYQAISAEAGAQFGMGLDFVIYDELAQAKTRTLYDALMTSSGSQPEPLMMIISTQAPNDQHILSELIDYGTRVRDGIIDDPSFVSHVYSVPMTADMADERQWHKANPGIGDFRDLVEMRTAVQRAIKMPSEESTIRVYYLNQRVRAEAPFLSPSVYDAGGGPIDEAIFTDGRPVFGGLDLSLTTDLSALVLAAEDDNGVVHLKPYVWTPADTLAERAQRDRAPYEAWERSGYLIAVPGKVIDYDWIATLLAELNAEMNIQQINYDRWEIKRFTQDLDRIGISLPLEPMGQGFQDMSPAVKAFAHLATNGQIRHGNHPLMRWCFANAVIKRDPSDNRKLDKSKAYGRIDVAVAAVMAVGALKVTTATPEYDIAALIG
jgi:phage terminase large subunit-like protein